MPKFFLHSIVRDYVRLAKGFPALALMSEDDLAQDFAPFAKALEAALDPIVADFRRQLVSTLCSAVVNLRSRQYC